MNISHAPTFQAVRDLYERHYSESGARQDRNDEHYSSHWKQYTRACALSLDEGGDIRAMAACGFGGYSDQRLVKRCTDYVTCGVHCALSKDPFALLSLLRAGSRMVKRLGFGNHYVSYDLFRQMHALATIRKWFRSDGSDRPIILVIGDGYGLFTALAKEVWPRASFVLCDIGRTLIFQCIYLGMLFPGHKHALAGRGEQGSGGDSGQDFLYCEADDLETLPNIGFRLAVNVCSMQEMTKREIERYFCLLRGHAAPDALFYCCNRESKVLPDGEEIKFCEYPWQPGDHHLLDEESPVYRFWLSRTWSGRGPTFLGVRIPFTKAAEGPVRHRLTKLAKAM